MFRKLRTPLFRSDRAENSLMVVISQQVSLIVMAALAGLMFILITGGVRIQAENAAQTELRIANRAFTNDVDQAAKIFIQDDTKMTLSSTKFLKDAAGKYVCRASSWYIAPASDEIRKTRANATLMSVYNDVTVYTTPDCTGTPKSTQSRVAVSGVTDNSTFKYENVAGVPIQFSNGVVTTFNTAGIAPDKTTGIVPAAAMTKFRADNAVDSWYTNDEMIREVPKVIEAKLTAYLPITEENAASFKATTNEAETELVGNNNDITDPGGEQTRWVPNPVSDVFVKRSPTTGNYVGGVREGIQISWPARPIYECSPTQTLVYTWLVTNIRTNHQSSGDTSALTAHVATGIGGAAEIWNGGNYRVQVSGRCNDIDGQSGDKAATYTLPLPNVVNVSVAAVGTQANHNVTWKSATTDPTVKYEVRYSAANASVPQSTYGTAPTAGPSLISEEAGAADGAYSYSTWMYASMPWSVVGSPSTNSFTKNGNAVVAGYPDTYDVKASTTDSPNTSGLRTPANYIYGSGVVTPPNLTWIDPTTSSWDPATCAVGNSLEYRVDYTNNYGGADATNLAGKPAVTSRTINYPEINQASRIWVRVDARCVTAFTQNPTNGHTTDGLTPWNDPDEVDSWIRPYGTIAYPNPMMNTEINSGNGEPSRISWGGVDCPRGSSRDYYNVYTSNSSAGNAPAFTTDTTRVVTHSEAPGNIYYWQVQTRCASNESGGYMEAYSVPNGNAYYTIVRPPSSATIVRTASSVPIGTAVRIYGQSVNGCAANTNPTWASSLDTTRTGPVGTSSFSVSGYCAGVNGQRSGNVGASTTVNWYQPAPTTPSNLDVSGTWSPTTVGGYMLNNANPSASGSSNATSYTAQVRTRTMSGWTGWSGSLGCIDNTYDLDIQGRANGPGGSSAWATRSGSVSTMLDRINTGC